MKKLIILSFIFLILQNCGYAPMYGKNQKINFYIESINFDDGDEDLADYIEINLRNYLKDNSKTKIKIDAKIDYQKNIVTKDSTGEAEEYELLAFISFITTNQDTTREILISESFKMKNYSDEFEERRYEDSIKQTMARSITSKLIIQLSRLNVN